MPRFHVEEIRVVPKTGDPALCEDMVTDGPDFVVVADGATDKSGLRFDGLTGGRLVAELICGTVSAAASNTRGPDLVRRVNEAYAAAFGSALRVADRVDWPSASFVALDKACGRVIRVGDCSWLSDRRSFIGSKLVDVLASSERAAHLKRLLAAGAPINELRENDVGRRLILPALRAAGAWRNNDSGPLGFGAVDGGLVPARFIEEWLVTDDESVVVLCTDGFPDPYLSVSESELVLAEDLAADPLRVGKHLSTKACGAFGSFDDRALMRALRSRVTTRW